MMRYAQVLNLEAGRLTWLGNGSGIGSAPSRPRSVAADGTPGRAFGTAATSACKNSGKPAMRVRGKPGAPAEGAPACPVRVLSKSSACPDACVTKVDVWECAAVGEMFSDTPQERKDRVRESAWVVERSRDTSERPSRAYEWSRGDLQRACPSAGSRICGSDRTVRSMCSRVQPHLDRVDVQFALLFLITMEGSVTMQQQPGGTWRKSLQRSWDQCKDADGAEFGDTSGSSDLPFT